MMKLNDFIHQISWNDLPEAVRHQARRCLLDTLGTAIGGRQTELSRIIYEVAASVYGGAGARLWFDGRQVSPPGAALAHGMTIDSLDIHDGYQLTKGHAGVAIIPATLATLKLGRNISGQELLTTVVIGYEIALRAGLALHSTACDYHTSGAWNALGCAAVTARRLGLTEAQTRHALGSAEYHGPRSQMMRCIDYPTMLKDGSGWGAMAGVSAALLARGGFTGAPALTVEAPEAAEFWADLGRRWLILDQYFKPYPVCYWAQPAIAAALRLREVHQLRPEDMRRVQIVTFHEATRLACRRPQATDEAQYSLPFPVAAALVHGRVGPAEVTGTGLHDPQVLEMAGQIELVETERFNTLFPATRLAQVIIETADGVTLDSGETGPPWNTTNPPTDAALRGKFHALAGSYLPEERVAALEETVWHCAELQDGLTLLTLLVDQEQRRVYSM